MAKLGQRFTEGNMVICTQAGKMVSKRMELVLIGVCKFKLSAKLLYTAQQFSLSDSGKNKAATFFRNSQHMMPAKAHGNRLPPGSKSVLDW